MQNIMNDTVANIWAEMSEEERQDKILSVMDNVDAAIKFAAYDWNELPDGITNLIDSNAPLNELSPETKMSAFKKAATYTRKPGEITNKVLHNKRMSQAYTFEKHVSPQLQAQANTIAKLIGPEFIASIDKGIYGTEEMPEISIKFFEPTNKQNNAALHVYSGTGYNAGEISTDLKLNNIELSEPIQRKLVRFADAVYKSEISSNLKENHNIKNTMNKSLLKSLIRECYQEVLAEKSIASKKMSKIKSLKENDTKTVEDAIKSGKIKPEEVKAAAEKAMKGDSTALAMMMAGIPNMMQENEEMDLPSDTGKNINMGFDNSVGLDVDKRMSKNMSEVMSKIEKLKAQLKPSIEAFNSKKITRQQYDEATIGLRASLAAAKADLEKMMAKL